MMVDKLYEIYRQHPAVQTDTRKLIPGEIFFALKGEHFNGNQFAKTALEMGAAAVVVDEEIHVTDDRLFTVPDVLKALQDLALHHRKQFQIPFIAITGSNGKTTTKELVHAVLSTTFRTATTKGNFNNHIGIPLTILSIPMDAEMAVIEMGANHQKEIEAYCTYTLPTHGIITNCGKAHLEGFGGVEGVKKGKGELFDFLRDHHGFAFVMWDYDYFHLMSHGIQNMITYGTTNASITGNVQQSEPFLHVVMSSGTSLNIIETQMVGGYNLPNVLAAVAIGKFFGVEEQNIKTAIESYVPNNSRSQWISKGSNSIILDAYNANPSSMKLAIENFSLQSHEPKFLMIGGMMELGEESIAEHQAIIDLTHSLNLKNVILVGGDFKKIDHTYRYFENASDAGIWLKKESVKNALFLIKGSRSMKMENILQAFE
ncbi:MAG: UDP-N-acetylmuramoyl-tripeptide--D-alanyl-D-alanine ligase [Chitinophagaceae bacterium]